MEIKLQILRCRRTDKKSYKQSFLYETEEAGDTVATALRALESRKPLLDAQGNPADPVKWECNCLQKKCGACAMVINGRPRLACDARLSEFSGIVKLEPLKKFPVIEDLMVDRSSMFENLKQIRLWFEDDAVTKDRTAYEAYEASRCLQCGCCLEVCPNFMTGGMYSGMASAVPMSRLIAKMPETQKKEASRLYRKHFYEGCGKSLACRDICPAKIDIESLMVNSNAAAVWKHFFR